MQGLEHLLDELLLQARVAEVREDLQLPEDRARTELERLDGRVDHLETHGERVNKTRVDAI